MQHHRFKPSRVFHQRYNLKQHESILLHVLACGDWPAFKLQKLRSERVCNISNVHLFHVLRHVPPIRIPDQHLRRSARRPNMSTDFHFPGSVASIDNVLVGLLQDQGGSHVDRLCSSDQHYWPAIALPKDLLNPSKIAQLTKGHCRL